MRSHPDDAAIIIQSTITQLQFESNTLGITDTKEEEGKYTIFLKPETQIITVKKNGYMEGKLPAMYLRAKEVKYFKIDEKGSSSVEIPVNIITEPKGAKIYIDGHFQGIEQTHQISKGVHVLKIEMEGYNTIEKSIEISPANTLFDFKLQSIDPVGIDIKSQPDKAAIFVDNIQKGETNKGLFLYPGKHSLKLTKSGYLPYEQEIEIKEGLPEVNIILKRNIGFLSITTDPQGCDVFVNKEKQVSYNNLELAPGKYKIEIKNIGYIDQEDYIEIGVDQKITKTYTLVQRTGTLQFTVSPLEATVELLKDGKVFQTWKGTKYIKSIGVGSYELKCSYDGYSGLSKTISINENQTTTEEITLKKMEKVNNSLSEDNSALGSITYSGKIYHIVQIGNQYWLKENLDVGNMIKGNQEQSNNGIIEKYCYNEDPENCNKYGGLYQWNEAMQYRTTPGSQGICPTGWHIPTNTEFTSFKTAVNNDGNALKAIGQGDGGGSGTNASGFSALLSGEGNTYGTGTFDGLSDWTNFWSSSEFDAWNAYNLTLASHISVIVYEEISHMVNRKNVRCLKDF